MEIRKVITSGKRKRAVAKATIVEGTGIVTVNKRDYHLFPFFDRLKLEEPLS